MDQKGKKNSESFFFNLI